MSVTTLRAGSSTDLGRRQVNQDRIHVDDRQGIYAVADGMGGHRGGATAAEMAVAVLAETSVATSDTLIAVVEQANAAIYQRSQNDPDLHGMGTTITAMALVNSDGEERLAIANVGDSRAYRLRSGELELLTEDHNIVSELVRDGHLSATEAKTHRQRSVLTRAVGVEPGVAVDVIEILPSIGDRYLLCSDGLTGDVDSNQIAGILRRYADPDEACRDLIRVALASGSKDNISAVVVDVQSDGDAALHASQQVTPSSSASTDDTVSLSRMGTHEVVPEPAVTALTPPASAVGPTKPRSRLVTVRALGFVAALAAIGAVAFWAITNSPEQTVVPPLTLIETTTATSLTSATTVVPSVATTLVSTTSLTTQETLIPEAGLAGDSLVTPTSATLGTIPTVSSVKAGKSGTSVPSQ
jgi:PPM family protein phosphatase